MKRNAFPSWRAAAAALGLEVDEEEEGAEVEVSEELDDDDASGERQSISPHSSRSSGEPRPHAGGAFDA